MTTIDNAYHNFSKERFPLPSGAQLSALEQRMGVVLSDDYAIRQRISGAVPVGDDGGGHVIFYQEGKHGFGLYHVGYGNLDGNDAIWIAPTLASFLTRCVGIESF